LIMLPGKCLAEYAPVVLRSDLISGHETPVLQVDTVVAANGDIIVSGEEMGDTIPGDRVSFFRSGDGGSTWTGPYLTLEADNPTCHGVSVTSMNRRDDGVILMCRGTYASPTGLENRKVLSQDVLASRDNGLTFTFLSSVPIHPAGLNAPYLNMVLFPGGDLIMPGFVENLGCGYWRSDDGGASWHDFRVVWQDPPNGASDPLWFNETSYVVTDNGPIVAVARNDVNKVFYTIRSDDGGSSWTEPRALNLVGGSPALHKMPDSRLLLAYRDAAAPGLALAVSDDEGQSWQFAYHLPLPKGVPPFDKVHWTRPTDDQAWQPLEGHFGYPGFADLPGGDVYVTWHVVNRDMRVPEGKPQMCAVGTLLSGHEVVQIEERLLSAARIGTLLRAQKRTGVAALAALVAPEESHGRAVTPLRIVNRTSLDAEVHDQEDDLFIVLDGEAIFHLGGELLNSYEYSPGNRAGTDTQGHVRAYRVGPGDLVYIPRGTVHRITCADGFVEVIVVKNIDSE
jgi:mannose-6-phosphate isomerase-like protein (cupin superfamily)